MKYESRKYRNEHAMAILGPSYGNPFWEQIETE